jgi:alpha-N-arabinofuranosidase
MTAPEDHETAPSSGSLATLIVDPDFTVGPVNRRVFGSFVEHLGRCVYDGIHEPGHPTADADGFRQDVLELVRELGVTTVRYPGGNFVSGYRWEDGVGPRETRPRRLDLAWHSTETNQVGLHEFAGWLERTGAELMLAVNLGTRGLEEALDLVEYANVRSGTALSQQRIDNGRTEPFDVRMWCLGNEMDGPWQLGHRTADEYGALATKVARGIRQLDPRVELVVCGSSNAQMPTFGTWERTVLEHAYDEVDYISCHVYYEEKDGDLASFLASGTAMDTFIEEIVATIDSVKAARRSDRQINISFDEWNVWYNTRFESEERITDIENWPEAPRLLEDSYSVADAVVVGGLLISLLKHADRVTAASLAQLVNVIAPIMTEPGGPTWRQTTFFPFAAASRLARGTALRPRLTAPKHPTAEHGAVPSVDAVAVLDEEGGAITVFAVNRHPTDSIDLQLDLRSTAVQHGGAEAWLLHDENPYAKNTLDDRERIAPQPLATTVNDTGHLVVTLPPVSWATVSLPLTP